MQRERAPPTLAASHVKPYSEANSPNYPSQASDYE
jgi:hypothetical protein